MASLLTPSSGQQGRVPSMGLWVNALINRWLCEKKELLAVGTAGGATQLLCQGIGLWCIQQGGKGQNTFLMKYSETRYELGAWLYRTVKIWTILACPKADHQALRKALTEKV